jgi:outer membrane protein, heavy metal efflux system
VLSRHLSILVAAGVICLPSMGWAAEPLRLEEAVARALAGNPALVAEAAQLRAVEARAEREGLATPYVLGGELENAVGTGSLKGLDSAETTMRIARVIELGGKRTARQALGKAEIGQQEVLAEIARLDLVSRTTTRFIEVVADQQRLAYAREQVEQAGRTRDAVEGWVRAARNPESDLRAAEIAVTEAELAEEHARHELESARVSLAASWGALAPDFESAAGDLHLLPQTESFEVLAARLPMSARQRVALVEAETIAARRRVAQAAAHPDLNLSLGVRRLEAFNDEGLVMSVSVPLGARSRARHGIAEADAQLAALQARRDADRFERHQAFFELYQELLHARTEFEAYRDRMLPKAEEALQFTRRGFEAGRFSFASLAQAQKTFFDLRGRALAAATHYHQALVEVQRLTTASQETQP